MKITIGKKLLGGFIFVLLLLVIESVVSNNVINSTQQSYKKLLDENMGNVMLAHELDNYYIKQSDAVRSYILTGDEAYRSQFEKYVQKAKNTINRMSKTFKTEEDQEIIQQLAAFQLRYEEIVRKEFAFKKEGNIAGYTNLLMTSSKTISNVFQGKIDALIQGQEQLMQKGSKEVAGSVEQTKKFVIYLGVFSILTGTALSFMIGHSISKPLYTLAKYTEKFIIQQKGKMNSDFPKIKSSTYEVKQLSQSLQLAMKEINHHINQLNIDIQTDALTGLANRRTFDLVINEQIYDRTPFSLIFLDIDFFKKVNDTYGHLVGDDVLRFLAYMMKELTRKGDLCFRYGGEEFAIIVPYGDRDTTIEIAERLRMKLESTVCPTGETITISLGIAFYPEHGQNSDEIISAADEALYISKSEGRNKTTLFSKISAQL